MLAKYKDNWAGPPRTTRYLMLWNTAEIVGSDVSNLMTVSCVIITAQLHCVDNKKMQSMSLFTPTS